jgi:hypothetical protein
VPERSRAVLGIGILALASLASTRTFARQTPRSLSGDWTATAGSQVFRGEWTAETSSRSPHSAYGSWTLIAGDGELVAEGTWSARKSSRGWYGTWTARAGNGRPLSGSWDAAISDPKIKTFAAMFAATIKEQISGDWHAGGQRGNWWLQASDRGSGKP